MKAGEPHHSLEDNFPPPVIGKENEETGLNNIIKCQVQK